MKVGRRKGECLLAGKTVVGIPALILENDYLFLTLVPDAGGKIQELIFKPTGNDFAWHSPVTPLKIPKYGSEFSPFDSGGFDEMLPTVGECDWRGAHLPDHGEAWQLPARVVEEISEPERVGVRTEWVLKASPFLLERTVSLSGGESRVRFDYRIKNQGNKPWEFIWALHASVAPGGKVRKGTRLFLPRTTRLNVWWSKDERLGRQGTWLNWPKELDKQEKKVDLSTLEGEAGFAEKLFTEELKEGWVAALEPETREAIGFSFSPEELPYAGIWLNQGGWRGYCQLGLEATSAMGDNLEQAVKKYQKRYSRLNPGQSFSFGLWVSLGQGMDSIGSITPAGTFIEPGLKLKAGYIKGALVAPFRGTLEIIERSQPDDILLREFLIPYKRCEISLLGSSGKNYDIILKHWQGDLVDSISIKQAQR